jgi:hypothetical protein
MIWPLFRTIGDVDDGDYARDSASHCADDPANDGARTSEMITAATRFTGTANPEACAQAVTQRLLPDLLAHRVGTPASFGFAGFNGRTLADNAPEVMYSLMTDTGSRPDSRLPRRPVPVATRFPNLSPQRKIRSEKALVVTHIPCRRLDASTCRPPDDSGRGWRSVPRSTVSAW